MVDLSVLQALAEEAGGVEAWCAVWPNEPGQDHFFTVWTRGEKPWKRVCLTGPEELPFSRPLAEYIAACSPEAVLWLIGRARRADELETGISRLRVVAEERNNSGFGAMSAFYVAEELTQLLGRGDT